MTTNSLNFMLENGLNLRDVVTTGSVLHIDQIIEEETKSEFDKCDIKSVDVIGKPVANFGTLIETMVNIDKDGLVKKKQLEEGGGLPISDCCTVSISYSGYFENKLEPFDVVPSNKPLIVDLKNNGLLPGLQIAVESMLVGEVSMFLLSHKVMYGDMGIPPRIKPKADCVFYIKLVKSILTPKEGKIDFAEPNMLQRINHEVKLLYASGSTLYKTNNYVAAIQVFKKAVNMLHKCRLADEKEERLQEKMLKKLYINLVICYNKVNKPLLACTACNELNRLGSLWNNGKVLFQNAKALRLIGEYDAAEKRLQRAIKLVGQNDVLSAELELIGNARQTYIKSDNGKETLRDLGAVDLITEEFKAEVDELIRTYKYSQENDDLILPTNLNSDEINYLKEVCIKENLFFTKIKKDDNEYSLDETH